MRYAALLVVLLSLAGCDMNECGTIDMTGASITAAIEIDIDCPGDQDISPGNTFDAEGTVTGLINPAPPQEVNSGTIRTTAAARIQGQRLRTSD